MSNMYTLLTAVILVVIFAVVIAVAVGLYISSRRERAEKAAAVAAAAPLAPVAVAADNAFFAGVENSNNIILEASKERPRRGTGYGATKEADEFEL